MKFDAAGNGSKGCQDAKKASCQEAAAEKAHAKGGGQEADAKKAPCQEAAAKKVHAEMLQRS